MLRRLWHRFFGRSVIWQRSIIETGDLEALARAGLAGMLMAQEKARLDFLSAREAYECSLDRTSRQLMHECLAHLQATNAVVQSLLNEHQLEQRLAAEPPQPDMAVGKSR